MSMLSVLAVSFEDTRYAGAADLFRSPPVTHTAMLSSESTTNLAQDRDLSKRHPFNGYGLPNDIAKMAVVPASDDASWMTGACIPVDGGYTAR